MGQRKTISKPRKTHHLLAVRHMGPTDLNHLQDLHLQPATVQHSWIMLKDESELQVIVNKCFIFSVELQHCKANLPFMCECFTQKFIFWIASHFILLKSFWWSRRAGSMQISSLCTAMELLSLFSLAASVTGGYFSLPDVHTSRSAHSSVKQKTSSSSYSSALHESHASWQLKKHESRDGSERWVFPLLPV